MIYRLCVIAAAIFILLTLLSGCGSVPPVVTAGACHIPERLDYEAAGPVPLSEIDTPLANHLRDDIKDRVAHRRLSDDYNALRGHIRGC